MGKSFFAWIADFINGTPKEEKSTNNIKKEADNGIEKKGDLQNAVIRSLRSNYFGTKISFTNKSFTLWINDNLFYNSLVSGNFKKELTTSISDELGLEFGLIEISVGPATDNNVTEVMDNCYLQIKPIQIQQSIAQAIIYPVAGNGSIIDGAVFIDSQKIRQLPNCRYNIGRGKHPAMTDGCHRENHIAIDDDPNSHEFDKNRYVSRAHGHISYSEELGFMLWAELGGTRATGKRTHIDRGGEKIELNNTMVPEPLQDGDYMILSKFVHLLFKKA